MSRRKLDLRILFAIIWMAFTTALAVWMLIFNVSFIERMQALSLPSVSDLERHHRMVFWEMLSLILSLLIGGAALFALIFQERRRAFQIQKFFATFTHELKTSLSRLKLQTEGIMDDFKSSELGRPALQLLEDLGRLEVQLENSLFLARGSEQSVFIQDVPLSRLISSLSPQFPLQVSLKSEVKLRADLRILESVFKNLMQNAVVHGEAQVFLIQPEDLGHGRVRLNIQDDGKGFQGDRKKLGELFAPQGPTGGSGLGLSLARQLLPQMQAQLRFLESASGFQVEIEMPGGIPPVLRSKAGGQ